MNKSALITCLSALGLGLAKKGLFGSFTKLKRGIRPFIDFDFRIDFVVNPSLIQELEDYLSINNFRECQEQFDGEMGKEFLRRFDLTDFVSFFATQEYEDILFGVDGNDPNVMTIRFWFITDAVYDANSWDELDSILTKDVIEDMRMDNFPKMKLALENIFPYINEIMGQDYILGVDGVYFFGWEYDDMEQVILNADTGEEYKLPGSSAVKLRRK